MREIDGRTYFIFLTVKLLAPKMSMSFRDTLYPFGPIVKDNESSSITNGSTDGNSISFIPVARYGRKWCKDPIKQSNNFGSSSAHCLI